jgi:predicted nucleic acid-binding protein
MAWLLDTNVLSELRRPRPHAPVVDFVAHCPLEQLSVSTVTLAEIRFGIALVADAVRRADLENWLARRVRPLFAHRVLQLSENILLRWRLLIEHGRTLGTPSRNPIS